MNPFVDGARVGFVGGVSEAKGDVNVGAEEILSGLRKQMDY